MKDSIGIFLTVVALSGCAAVPVAPKEVYALPEGARVAVVRPDIKYYKVTANGIPEPAPDWTRTARKNFDSAFAAYVARSGIRISSPDPAGISESFFEFTRLHTAVGGSILRHHFGPDKLPAKFLVKSGRYEFDWSLGKGMAGLGLESDYVLFIYFRGYQATGGRIDMATLAAVLRLPIDMGHQGGFASLVNLNTGDVVWFNHRPATADLRLRTSAETFVEELLSGVSPMGG